MRALSNASELLPVIAGRYEVLTILGRGGMGSVYAALDRTTGRNLAVKRLVPDAKPAIAEQFEREYQTLAGLRHPSIVEVFEYGSDEQGAYYTMELLEGQDLSGLAPLPWREVCRYLRDTASILSLLHARRLVHRDLSPRNLWRTRDGNIKLIDFGALASFGPSKDLLGTPPFVPPEALISKLLDQRSDLYSLGALGYLLLSGSHAFAAQSFADLTRLWEHEPAPLARLAKLSSNPLLAEIPPELDAQILSLLRRDPDHRPASAEELIDRLNAIADLKPEADQDAAQAFLKSGAFVGRSRERGSFAELLDEALVGNVRALFVQGAPGIGRSRLLEECLLSARVEGAVPISTRAIAGSHPYATACALAEELLGACPEDAEREARSRAAVLGHLSPALRERLGLKQADLSPLPSDADEQRFLLQSSLQQWFLAVSRDRALVLAVDNLHQADEESQALLAVLARAEPGHRLLILASAVQETGVQWSKAVFSLRSASTRVHLVPLSASETRELLSSVFGNADYLERLAERLQRLCEGNPAHCLELAQHLVRVGAARFANGAWRLPREFSGIQFPRDRSEQMLRRLEQLSPDQRQLARCLTLVRQGEVSEELCRAAWGRSAADTQSALSALRRAAVLQQTGEAYAFADETLREALRAELSGELSKQVHLRLAEAIIGGAPDELGQLRAGLHFLKADDMARGGELVFRSCRFFSENQTERMNATAPLVEEAIEILKARDAHAGLLAHPAAVLAHAGYYLDRRYAVRHGEFAISLMQSIVRVDLARKWARFVGRKLAIIAALVVSGVRLRRMPSPRPHLPEAVRLLLSCASTLAGVSAMCLDADACDHYARASEPLSWLGKYRPASVVYQCTKVLGDRSRAAVAKPARRTRELLALLTSDLPLPGIAPHVRGRYTAGLRFGLAVSESWRDSKAALAMADELEKGSGFYALTADHLRASCYANQGDLVAAKRHRQRVETHAIQLGSAWQVETWSSADNLKTALLTHDALAMKHVAQDLARLTGEIPTFQHHARTAEGAYLIMREKYAEAIQVLDHDPTPMAMLGWGRTRALLARALSGVGEYARARQICLDALARLDPEDLGYPLLNGNLTIELALAEAQLGELASAKARLEQELKLHGDNQGPLVRGALLDAFARVALIEGDYAGCAAFIARMEDCYRGIAAASLHERVEGLRRRLSQAQQPALADDLDIKQFTDSSHLMTQVQLILQHAGTRLTERARRGLQIAMELTGADSGFMVIEGHAEAVAHLGSSAPSSGLSDWAHERLTGAVAADETAAVDEVESLVNLSVRTEGDLQFCVAPLWALREGADLVVAAIALGFRSGTPCLPSAQVLRVIAGHLAEVTTQERSVEGL